MWKILPLFVCVLFFGFTDENSYKNDQVPEAQNQVDTKNDESTIPIYEVVFDSSKEISGQILKDVLPTISKSFDAYAYTSSSNELKEKIEHMEAQRFLISLAKDFDNKTFESVKAIDFVNVSPNASIARNVKVGEGSHIGMGSTIVQGVSVGKWAVIGAGTVILEDVPDYAVVVGVPGKIIKYNSRNE